MNSVILAALISVSVPSKINTTSIVVVNQYPETTIITVGDLNKVLICRNPNDDAMEVSLVVPEMFKDQVTAITVTCAAGKLWLQPFVRK